MTTNSTSHRKPSMARAFWICVGHLAIPALAVGQGTVIFGNRVISGVDAPVFEADGVTRLREGFIAQLYGGPASLPVEMLSPLYPVTTFRTGPSLGYVWPVIVAIPDVPAGGTAKVVMRVYDGASWENSLTRGESNPFLTSLGIDGGTAAALIGLKAFSVSAVPEPSPIALIVCGLATVWVGGKLRRRSRRGQEALP